MFSIWHIIVASLCTLSNTVGVELLSVNTEAIYSTIASSLLRAQPTAIDSLIELKCLEYIVNRNVHESDLIILWPEQTLYEHTAFIQHIMKTNNIVIIN